MTLQAAAAAAAAAKQSILQIALAKCHGLVKVR